MQARFDTLIRLELCNIYGLNVFRFSRDKEVKKRAAIMLAAGCVLLAMLVFYMGGLSYGLIFLGLGEAVPAYLTAVASLVIFFFGLLKAGSVIFRREGYDILCALPVSKTAVVVSRLVRMYVENMLMVLTVLLPGVFVYVWEVRPGLGFYPAVFFWVLSVPFIPMAGAVLAGMVIAGISSRMRYKALVAAGLSILSVLVVLYLTSRISIMESGADMQMLKEISVHILMLLDKIYPPAVWVGTAVASGALGRCVLCAGFSFAVFAAVAMGVSLCFQQICQRLYSSPAKHDYKMEKLKERSVLSALCRRESKRYFSSSVYVTNTIIGPAMGCVCAGILFAVGAESLPGELPFFVDVERIAPFILAGMFCMMTPASTSISMEGKNWWILRSFPLEMRDILDAKVLMSLLLFLPFYVLSEILLLMALAPGILGAAWLMLIPAVLILFSCVYGITVNLHFPVLDQENEVYVVKQSTSAVLGGVGGFVLTLFCAVGAALIPAGYLDIYRGSVCMAALLAAFFLRRRNAEDGSYLL